MDVWVTDALAGCCAFAAAATIVSSLSTSTRLAIVASAFGSVEAARRDRVAVRGALSLFCLMATFFFGAWKHALWNEAGNGVLFHLAALACNICLGAAAALWCAVNGGVRRAVSNGGAAEPLRLRLRAIGVFLFATANQLWRGPAFNAALVSVGVAAVDTLTTLPVFVGKHEWKLVGLALGSIVAVSLSAKMWVFGPAKEDGSWIEALAGDSYAHIWLGMVAVPVLRQFFVKSALVAGQTVPFGKKEKPVEWWRST